MLAWNFRSGVWSAWLWSRLHPLNVLTWRRSELGSWGDLIPATMRYCWLLIYKEDHKDDLFCWWLGSSEKREEEREEAPERVGETWPRLPVHLKRLWFYFLRVQGLGPHLWLTPQRESRCGLLARTETQLGASLTCTVFSGKSSFLDLLSLP